MLKCMIALAAQTEKRPTVFGVLKPDPLSEKSWLGKFYYITTTNSTNAWNVRLTGALPQ